MRYLETFRPTDTVYVPFATSDASGGRADPDDAFEVADFRVYKNTIATANRISSEDSFSLLNTADDMVGLHQLSIDLTAGPSGFFAVGNEYIVVMYPDELIDGETVGVVLAQFGIENRFTDSVTFTPVAVTVSSGAITGNNITQYENAAFGPFLFTIVDSDDNPVDLSDSEMSFLVYRRNNPNTVLWSLESLGTGLGGDIEVGGDDSNQVTVSDDDTNTGSPAIYRYVLWDTTNDQVRARGLLTIVPEATS